MNKKSSTPLRIDNGGYSQFDNPLHAQFHRTQYDYVSAVNQAKLNMPADALAEWKRNIDLEVEINKEAEASIHTANMLAKDKERDLVLTYIFGVVRINKIAPDEQMQEAARKLDVVLKPYYGIQKDPLESESLHIVGMRNDLDKLSADVNALNLSSALGKLYLLNDEFEKLRKSRRSESGPVMALSSREVRSATDEAFSKVCIYVLSANLHAASDEDRELVSKLINDMNIVSRDFRANNNEIMAQRKAAAKKKKDGKKPDDKGGKQPDDKNPKQPDDKGKQPDPKKPEREEDPGEDQA